MSKCRKAKTKRCGNGAKIRKGRKIVKKFLHKAKKKSV